MSRHTPVERLPSGLFFTANFARPRGAVESKEVNPGGGAPKKIVFAHLSPITPESPLPATRDYESPCSSRSSSIGEPDQAPTSLPLLDVSVEVNVEGFIAHTTLVQRFDNPFNETITQARYTFPLYDGAVVTSFWCAIGTERVLQGKMKPKKEARRKYKEAVEKKEVAALLEEHTPEVFETVVGHIPAKTAVQVNIAYANELKAATGQLLTEGLSVILPTSIAPRYSRGPKKYREVNNLKNGDLDITITVPNDDGHVRDIISESGHNIFLEKKTVARPPQVITNLDDLGDDGPRAPTDVNILQATYNSTTPVLQGDFIAIIQMQDSWPLRSRAALSITDKNGHAALMVNIKPSEVFSSAVQTKTFNDEIVFVVDQSGSMIGEKIKTLRSALPLSLTSLPLNCAVNIVSFGSHTQFRWPTSQKYSAEVLKSAKKYASSVQADMGGTELLFALQEVVKSRLQDRSSMQIIVITDGEVEPEKIIRFVWQTRQELGDCVRFFALGIGDRVSHQLIECIGEFGGGYGETVDIQKGLKWEKKLIRMLKGAMMPNSWSCEIDLGLRFERRDSTTYDLSEQPPQAQDRIPYIQAPFPTPSLHPFRYQALHFLVDMKAFDERLRKQKLLGEIILRPHGEADRASEFPLKVDISSRNTDTIRQLTAKAILRQLEAELDRSPVSEAQRDLAQVNAEYLGTTYSIPSKWTSFVAVDEVTQEADEIDLYKANIKTVDHEDDLPEDLDLLIQTNAYRAPSAGLAAQFKYSEFDERRVENSLPAAIHQPNQSISPRHSSLSSSGNAVTMESLMPDPVDEAVDKSMSRREIMEKLKSTSGRHSMRERQSIRDVRWYGDVLGRNLGNVRNSHHTGQYAAASPHPMNATPPSDSNNLDGPILLQEAVATQDVTGIFEIDEPTRERLELHFCPRTLETLLDAISGAVPSETLATVTDIKASGYTMMLVHYIRTHLTQDQELWDLMVQKARDAVQQALTLKDDSLLVSLDQLLEKVLMHAHFRSTVDWSNVAQLVPFPPTSASEACPVCGKTCDKTPASSFKCTFLGCNDLSSGWSSWDELWKHQVENGHLVCHQKKSQPLARNEQRQEKRRVEKGGRALVQAKEEKRQQQTAKTAKTAKTLKTKRSFWDILLRRSK